MQGSGVGRLLLEKAEKAMRAMGALSVYADTSSTEHYRSSRSFYVSMGFHEQARLEDFYARGDAKVIYEKDLTE
jgi:ribosomal protein S18 acetylase RimI-like enzyme